MAVTDTPTEREREGAWVKLRHRKVVQWGLAYGAGAWGLAQALAHLVATFHWPESIQQIGTLVLIGGVPVTLVLAWYHGDKGKQNISGTELVMLAVVLAAVGGGVWWYGSRRDATTTSAGEIARAPHRTAPKDGPSVAVLPFANLSSDPEQEYFSDGLSEEILTALSRVSGLYVPARTSSFQFKEQNGNVAKIAALLGVATVLEGSVRKSGQRVRVTVQLVNAADGYNLWSETYDRELKDVFAIQEEIANGIVDALKIRLTPAQRLTVTDAPGTSNLDAYQAYLLGRHEAEKFTQKSLATAIEHFRAAVELDPLFADAYANLAVTLLAGKSHPNAPFIDKKQLDAYLAPEARPSLARAQEIGPGRAEVLAAAGRFARLDDDLNAALDYYDRALAVNPNNGDLLSQRTSLLWYMGRYKRALEASYEAVKRDPVSWSALNNHAIRLLLSDRRAEVEPIVQRETALNEVQGRGIQTIVVSYDGNRPEAVRQVLTIYDLLVGQSGDVGFGWRGAVAIKFAALGLRDEVFNVVDGYRAHYFMGEYTNALPELRRIYRERESLKRMLAESLYGAGHFDEALALYRELFATDRYPDTDSLLRAADAARRSGAPDEAAGYRDQASRVLDAAVKAGISPRAIAFSQAMLHAYDGRDDAAADALIRSLDTWHTWAWPYHPFQYRIPLVVHLTERQDVQAALRKHQGTIERQRAEVIEMLCGEQPVSKHYRPAPSTCALRRLSNLPPNRGK